MCTVSRRSQKAEWLAAISRHFTTRQVVQGELLSESGIEFVGYERYHALTAEGHTLYGPAAR
jgi:hypothetical protein